MTLCHICAEAMEVPKITIPANVGEPYPFCSDVCLVAAIVSDDMPDAMTIHREESKHHGTQTVHVVHEEGWRVHPHSVYREW